MNKADGADKKSEEHRLIAERRKKLTALRAEGFAFPNDYRRTVLAGALHATYGNQSDETLEAEPVEITIGGRLMAKAGHGQKQLWPVTGSDG